MPFGGLGVLADIAWLAANSTALNVQSIAVLSSGTVIRVDYGVALDASSDPAAGDYTLSGKPRGGHQDL